MRDLTFRVMALLATSGPMILVARAAEAGVSCINACQSQAGQPSCASTGLGCSLITHQCVSCRTNQDCQPGGTCLANGHCMIDCTGDGGATDGAAIDGMTPDATGGIDATAEDGAAARDATTADGATADANDAAATDSAPSDAMSTQETDGGNGGSGLPRNPIQTMPPSSGCSCHAAPPRTTAIFVVVALAFVIRRGFRDRGRR